MKQLFLFILLGIVISGNAQSRKTLKDNRVKTITTWQYDKLGEKVKKTVKTYNQQGNLIDKKSYDKDTKKLKSHSSYKYNAQNKKTEETKYNTNGKKKKIIRYTYKNGIKIQKKVLDGNGKLKSKKVYEIVTYK